MSVSFCLPHPVAVSAFMICRGLCACTEMLWICVLYVSFGSKVRPRTFGCVAMGSALLFIVRSRLLVYSAGSGVNRVQVVLSGFSKRLFCFVQTKTLCRYGCMYFLDALVLVCVEIYILLSTFSCLKFIISCFKQNQLVSGLFRGFVLEITLHCTNLPMLYSM